MFKATDLKVYFICGTQDIKSERMIHEVLKDALEAGITLYQFREKGPTALRGADKRQLAEELLALCHQYDVPLSSMMILSLLKLLTLMVFMWVRTTQQWQNLLLNLKIKSSV